MGRETPPLDERLRRFRDRARARWSIEAMLLFGSRARGQALATSDFDVILVSRDFEGMHFLERMRQALELWDGDVGLDVLCYTPAEFAVKRAQIGTVGTAVGEGVVLA